MFVRILSTVICLAVIFILGCGGGEPANPPSNDSGAQPAAEGQPAASDQAAISPAEQQKAAATVRAFIDAARQGDPDKTLGMMTVAAQKMLVDKKENIIRLPVTENAKVTVGRAVPRDGAIYVETILADFNAQRVCKEFEMVWVLRNEPAGYRVGGVALEVIPGQPPVLLNFEKSLQEQQEKIQKAIVAKQQYDAAQAAKANANSASRQVAQPTAQPPQPPTMPPTPYQQQPIHQATRVPAGNATPSGTQR